MDTLTELLRPWKLSALAIGVGLLVVGSYYYEAPDWDIPISIIMAMMAYLTASWSMHVMVERRWQQWPLMLFWTWFTVDGCYWLYWNFKNPVALELMREANAPASLSLYWMLRVSLVLPGDTTRNSGRPERNDGQFNDRRLKPEVKTVGRSTHDEHYLIGVSKCTVSIWLLCGMLFSVCSGEKCC